MFNDPLEKMQGMQAMPGVAGMHDFGSQPSQQGGVPDLFSLLESEYKRWLDLKIRERRASGKPTLSLEEALKKAPHSSFVNFCKEYLAQNRPVQQFPADANLGFMLSNNLRAVLCPHSGGHVGYGGGMQGAGDVQITRGESQPGMHGVTDGGGIGII